MYKIAVENLPALFRKIAADQELYFQDGEVAGLVEISFYLPETMVHYDRDKGE